MNKKHFILGILIILVDQLTKILMINKNITIIPDFLNFTYIKNTGAAFGIGTPIIVLLVNIIIVIGIILAIIKYKDKIKNYVPYTVLLAGGIGNLIDRIFRGYVIDFIHIDMFDFPVFNIADICVVVGVIIISYEIIRDEKSNGKISKK